LALLVLFNTIGNKFYYIGMQNKRAIYYLLYGPPVSGETTPAPILSRILNAHYVSVAEIAIAIWGVS
jgi:replication-associated recombination protein RarA